MSYDPRYDYDSIPSEASTLHLYWVEGNYEVASCYIEGLRILLDNLEAEIKQARNA